MRYTTPMHLPSLKFWLVVSPLFLLIAFGLFYISIVVSYQIDGISMLPNYSNNAVVTGITFFSKIKRGDIVTFAPATEFCPNQKPCVYVGRIVGLPKEKLEIANYFVTINDQQLDESYLAPETKTLFSEKVGGVFTLKDDEYFIMGDNRPYAADSRLFGPTKRKDIKAKVVENVFEELIGKIAFSRQ